MESLLVGNNSGPKIIVKVRDITIGEKEKVIISGPCSVENYNTMKEIAKELKDMGVHILRGGAFKPRTSPYDFQGLKYEGVKILHEVGKEFNMPIVTEIMDARDIEKCIDYIDMIQVGSRNMYNYTLLKELGKCNLPILLKRGMSATITEWLNAAEYIMSNGNESVVLCERGIRTFETYTRNTLDLNSVAVIKEKCRIPIVVDPSHGTGRRELVERMAIASIASGADGVMIESHIEPDSAISDSKQTVSMDIMKSIVSKVNELKNIF
ncbi:phospho-2-dehydro-3-deoxyheptonate aldolase [Clostridium argentinense CDC 2741]|uniref:Phospho-2-dehydro-3-deoxyheptonate aldolase n=1 Tax=Clostridium argentinense CDC 2741 TaxID=1418104 RepID=A0A0C1RA09_9CLOT|nr:3-deoxy-7-phosphoheptulonate synthase [Clostridium argentinense]ARC85260.1 3-deoxy-7-phosphoheptulonate synthase [Clostridium argentinense]KIE47286.1 phospho-2-dehydro-3-deoxyheptonate aldolase [Clostridium argentinense CDC 2741]NFF40876.1 3-deoxy-7-phosphoheptulonate synthase [Clostridium argentinense]NFP51412.1 3-deoxy-7-phosphoheptulonate synthase [Clostridium argentinense]NFP73450.1 3-deoxy-7-phosphoheptulonate synthase [Clostridium argentinense]